MIFTLTAFLGAALLFNIQPLVARLLLPAYGGSATVWSTCSLFFQVLLILGYVYSHVVTTRIPRRLQPRVHLLALAIPLLALPLALPLDAAPAADQVPVLWLLRTLAVMIGLPFVVLATSGPLLQRWYSWSSGPRAEDPYFLFAASNVGSFGGLLAYPFLIEPYFSLGEQTRGFSLGFLVFGVFAATCGFISLRGASACHAAVERHSDDSLSRRRIAVWTAYAFVPSCLMLAVTRHVSTDVAPIPLLWVAPLALYLATFVGAFAVRSRKMPNISPRISGGLGFAGILVAPLTSSLPLPFTVMFNLLLVGVVGYAAHRMLAADRPEPRHLTTFYLAVAVGGALGGLVNGLVAPLAFDSVLEYPLTLALLPLLCLGLRGESTSGKAPSVPGRRPVLLVMVLTLALLVATRLVPGVSGSITVFLAIAAFGLLGYVLSRLPGATAGCLVVVVVALTLFADGDIDSRERTFYGTYEVRTSGALTSLTHGTTMHGLQSRTAEEEREPTTYYARTGPLGDIMEVHGARDVIAVGLGIGTLAAYGESGDKYTFLEIDQAVVDIAQDQRYFTYLSGSDADVHVRVGDGRLLAGELPARQADLVVLDAFSSDAIPVHLLTHEAFDVYADRLRPGGAIAVHISNRHFDLVPVLAATADHLGWEAAVGSGVGGGLSTPSRWVLLGSDQAAIDALSSRNEWSSLDASRRVDWTDDYSSVLTVLK